jgi:branched-chain amino acid transport system substrate-binding protein
VARNKTQELVELHKVPVIIGPLATNEALAIDSYIRDTKVPLITTTSAATVDLKEPSGEPMGATRLRYSAAGDLSARRLRRQDPWLKGNGDTRIDTAVARPSP